MVHEKRKLWLGIGVCALITSPPGQAAAPPVPESAASPSVLLAAAGGEGGEGGASLGVFSGGEGGEGGEGAVRPSATESPGVYYSQLAFMLGHMRVGRALYQAGVPKIASTHLAHPAGEHLPVIRAALTQRGLDEVARKIEQLAAVAGSETEWSAIEETYAAAEAAVERAMADVDEKLLSDAGFLSDVLVAIVRQSRNEYAEAIEDGAFVLDFEYNDSWGFIQVGRDLLDRYGDVFRRVDTADSAELLEQYEQLMRAWPTPTVPPEPPLSVSEVYGRAAAFEFAASRF